MSKSHYNKKHKYLARELRKHGTHGEAVLWSNVLRARQFYGFQFNRQYPIDRYIVDFICRKIKLIIEIDGSSHQYKVSEDQVRDRHLSELGFRVLRVNESEILNDMNNVIRTIEACLPDDILNNQSA